MLFKNKIVRFYLNLIAAMKNLKWNGNNISLPRNPSFLKECLRLRKKVTKNNISWESFYFKDVSVLDNLSCLWILKDEEISRFFFFWRFSANFYSQSYSFTLSMLITFEFSSTGFLISIFYYIQCLSFFHYFSIKFFFYFDVLFYCEIAFFFLFRIIGAVLPEFSMLRNACLLILYFKDNLKHIQSCL